MTLPISPPKHPTPHISQGRVLSRTDFFRALLITCNSSLEGGFSHFNSLAGSKIRFDADEVTLLRAVGAGKQAVGILAQSSNGAPILLKVGFPCYRYVRAGDQRLAWMSEKSTPQSHMLDWGLEIIALKHARENQLEGTLPTYYWDEEIQNPVRRNMMTKVIAMSYEPGNLLNEFMTKALTVEAQVRKLSESLQAVCSTILKVHRAGLYLPDPVIANFLLRESDKEVECSAIDMTGALVLKDGSFRCPGGFEENVEFLKKARNYRALVANSLAAPTTLLNEVTRSIPELTSTRYPLMAEIKQIFKVKADDESALEVKLSVLRRALA